MSKIQTFRALFCRVCAKKRKKIPFNRRLEPIISGFIRTKLFESLQCSGLFLLYVSDTSRWRDYTQHPHERGNFPIFTVMRDHMRRRAITADHNNPHAFWYERSGPLKEVLVICTGRRVMSLLYPMYCWIATQKWIPCLFWWVVDSRDKQ